MIKAVLFDLDHTLYSREETLKKAAERLCTELSIEGGAKRLGEALVQNDPRLYHEDYSFAGQGAVYAAMLEEGVPLPPKEQFLPAYLDALCESCTPYPFTVPVLLDCRRRGLLVGMLTNGGHAIQDRKIESAGIAAYFDDMVMAADEGILKPNPEIFHLAAGRLGLLPEECIFVGDNLLDDISGAKDAGMRTVWIRQKRGLRDHLPRPDETIGSIEELPALLERLAAKDTPKTVRPQ